MVVQSWGVSLSFVQAARMVAEGLLVLWVGGFLLLFIGRLGLSDSFRIGSPKESTRLKVDGLFRFSRNPMYLGVYATVLASILYTLNPLVLLAAIFVIAVHHRIILAEEQHLHERSAKSTQTIAAVSGVTCSTATILRRWVVEAECGLWVPRSNLFNCALSIGSARSRNTAEQVWPCHPVHQISMAAVVATSSISVSPLPVPPDRSCRVRTGVLRFAC